METAFWILLVAAAGYGAMRLLQHRARVRDERTGRAEKRARLAKEEARSIQRSLAGRR